MSHIPKYFTAEEIQKIHPNLITWLKKEFLKIDENTIQAMVYSCAEPACPVEETILEWSDGLQKVQLRLPKSIDKINKMDFLLSVEKQKKRMLDSTGNE